MCVSVRAGHMYSSSAGGPRTGLPGLTARFCDRPPRRSEGHPPHERQRTRPGHLRRHPAKDRDPDWFKRAVFYEVLVRSFQDSNGDGIGDLKGLTAKLDYLQWLGVDCLWLPPFFKSPLRDGGYDVADYTSVLPEFGDLADFVEFVDSAHQRGMRVIIDFVMNHTSDQHPWFQESRKDPDGPYGDYYVWADDDKQFQDARIIFVDTEASNWTYDPVRKQYYWHRFFSHQPDLNYENPAVQEEMISALKFWLDLGIDGFRLDAVPYLYQQEGTNCENLPATHAFLKRVRKEIDTQYPDTVLLAEANQWPEDVVDYFGDYAAGRRRMPHGLPLPGHAPHLHGRAKGVPLPRLRDPRQDPRHPLRLPVGHLPAQPRRADPGNGHRRGTRLHVGRVRQGPRMRANIGIRRRLAPLLDNDRNQIELFTALLLSLPGSPIIYYGDEIGMGDNIWLGDRDAVRTPMQWTPDRNAGFSSSDPGRLYLPTIMDPVYGYQVTNVEASMASPSSLLHWTRRMIEIRKQNPAFGLGSYTELPSSNPAVLAFLREAPERGRRGRPRPLRQQLLPFRAAHGAGSQRLRGPAPGGAVRRGALPGHRRTAVPDDARGHGFYWFRLRKDAA